MRKSTQSEHFQSLILAGGHVPVQETCLPFQPAWYRLRDLNPNARDHLAKLSEFVNLL